MYDTISSIILNIMDGDYESALKMGAAILNDYESVMTDE